MVFAFFRFSLCCDIEHKYLRNKNGQKIKPSQENKNSITKVDLQGDICLKDHNFPGAFFVWRDLKKKDNPIEA